MKKLILGLLALTSVTVLQAEQVRALEILLNNGDKEQMLTADIDSLWFSNDYAHMFVSYKQNVNTYVARDIEKISYAMIEKPVMPTIVWSGSNVVITNPLSEAGVSITATGGDVFIVSTNEQEVEYILSGTSSDGSLHIVSTKKYQLTLNGVSLTNGDGPAINSQSGKKGTVLIQAGTTNTLTDSKKYASSTEDQKGTFFSEGQLIFKGSGTLNIYANNKHGICSDDYLDFRSGEINVLSAKKDAIHANDSVLVSGGKLTLTPTGDGIDCDGKIVISGGAIDITTTGDAAKGIKTNADIFISGGDINITQSGNKEIADGDVSYCMALKADTTVNISGGTIVINSSAEGGKGIKGTLGVLTTGGNITVNLTGSGGTYSKSAVAATGSGEGDDASSYIVYFYPYAQSSGMGGPGGGGSSWTNVKLYKSDGTEVATLSTTSVADNTAYYYNFGSAVEGSFYFGGTYKSGGGFGGGTTYTCKTSTFSAPTGTALYYRPGSYTTSGTTRTYTLVTWDPSATGGGSADSDTESFTACGIKSDDAIRLLAGTITINATGEKGTCGIKTDGDLTIGTASNGPTIRVSTTGAALGTSGSSGFGGGGGGGKASYYGDPKAVKVVGAITMENGDVVLSAIGTGGEAFESKTSIDLNGGYIYAYSQQDDAINCSGPINFNGAFAMAVSKNNDAVDSNYGKTGAITIAGGVAIGISSAGSPEEGFDCDNNSYIVVKGGCALSAGGSQGGGGGFGGSSGIGSSTQGYLLNTSSWTVQAKKYYHVTDASGNCFFSFLSPDNSANSSLSLITAPGMTSGSSYKVQYSSSAPSNPTVNMGDRIYTGGTVSDAMQALTFTAK